MFTAIVLGLTPAAAIADPADPAPPPPAQVIDTQATATASATILAAVRIDFSLIPAPRRPRPDGLRVAEFE